MVQGKAHVVPPPSSLHSVSPLLVLFMVNIVSLILLMRQQNRRISLQCRIYAHKGGNRLVGCALYVPLATYSADGMFVCVVVCVCFVMLCYLFTSHHSLES